MERREETFRSYTKSQGESYASGRPGYSPKLFQTIIDHHVATGGGTDLVVDVGCGTGQATRDLAPYFAHSIGLDPSEGMIHSARTYNYSCLSSLRFEVSAAEVLGADLERPITERSVDLLSAATAAHWFDMDRFWRRAAQVTKPNATVALWARTGMSINPLKTPNGVAIKAAIDDLNRELQPYSAAGNGLTRDLYIDLPLPWTLDPPLDGFDEKSFYRKEWNKRKDGLDPEDLGTSKIVSTEEFEKLEGTSSLVTRWREANHNKAETEEDVVKKARRRMDSLLHAAGVAPGKEILYGEVAIVLLMVKRL